MLRTVVLVAAVVLAVPAGSPASALAEPGQPAPAPPSPSLSVPAPPPVPPGPIAGDPALLLGPLDHLVPVTALDPEFYRMPDGSQPSPYALTEGAPPGAFAFVDELMGLHAMLHGALGRMPGSELGTALPGTAPAPATNLPPGLEEFLPATTPAGVPAPPVSAS